MTRAKQLGQREQRSVGNNAGTLSLFDCIQRVLVETHNDFELVLLITTTNRGDTYDFELVLLHTTTTRGDTY